MNQNQITRIEKELNTEAINSNNFYHSNISNIYLIPITNNELESLKKSKFLSPPLKLKKSPKKENLIIDILPIEILLLIMEYLVPGEIILLSMVCKFLNDLSKDKVLWMKLAIRFEKFFIWEKIITTPPDLRSNHQIAGKLKDYKKFFSKKSNHDISHLDPNFDPSLYEDLYEINKRISNTNQYIFKSVKRQRVFYLNQINNHQKHLLAKGKEIWKMLKEQKKKAFTNTYYSPSYEYRELWDSVFMFLSCFVPFFFLFSLILIHLRLDWGYPINIFWISSPLIFLGILFIINFSFLWRYYPSDWQVFFNFIFVLITLMFTITLITLKLNGKISTKFSIIFIPFYIMFMILIYEGINPLLLNPRSSTETMVSFFGVCILLFFFILLGFTLDGLIRNYALTFLFFGIGCEFLLYALSKSGAPFIVPFLLSVATFLFVAGSSLYGYGWVKSFLVCFSPIFLVDLSFCFVSFWFVIDNLRKLIESISSIYFR
ncbi:f-box only protein [Anaeramoeba ignava]|uniref:F-box only protein n=1 Tax=Anaeramoeba ignava TaxID=1746090 RepID=A0A9Q0RAB7_ANAIG|nr:f-box only protein [Anaeramoeba ignava]